MVDAETFYIRPHEQALLASIIAEERRLKAVEEKIHTTREWLKEAATFLRVGKSRAFIWAYLSEAPGISINIQDNTVSTKEFIKCC